MFKFFTILPTKKKLKTSAVPFPFFTISPFSDIEFFG